MKELDRAVAMLNFVEMVLMVQEETRLNLLGGHDLLRPVIPQLIQFTVKPIPRPKGKGQTTPLERIVGLEYESGQSRNSGNRHFIA